MNKDIKAEWLAELATLEQTTGRLQGLRADGKTGYCCLGGLCNVAARHGIGVWQDTDNDPEWHSGWRDFIATSPEDARGGETVRSPFTLPDRVVKWAGLPDDDYTGRHGSKITRERLETVLTDEEIDKVKDMEGWYGSGLALTDLNDSGISFATISKLIEKYL